MASMFSRLSASAYMAYSLRGQAHYAYRPLAAIEADRDRRVRRMVAYAYRYVPYYHDTMHRLGLRPEQFQTAQDLGKLPLLERQDLQRDPRYFVSTERPLQSYLVLSNSGTTGRPCTYYQDERALLQYAAHAGRARAVYEPLLGKRVGYRKTSLMGVRSTSYAIQQFYQQRAFLPPGVRLIRQQLSHLSTPEENTPQILSFAPDVLHSYGSCLALLFAFLKTSRQRLPSIKAVLYTADALPDPARRMIQEEFHLPIFSIYEATEAPNIAFECEQHRGLHINIDLCPVRIVNAQGGIAAPGVSGDVVISNLVNRGTVLLNYVLGDLAAMDPEPCPCGRSLPLLSQVQGRSQDWIELPSGRLRHSLGIDNAFSQPGVWQWQLVQQTATHFRAAIVEAKGCDREHTSSLVTQAFHELVGEGTTLDIHFVDEVERTAAGKVRCVISLRGQARVQQLMDNAGDRH